MIPIKTDKELQLMRTGGKILSEILSETGELLEEGMTTLDIEMRIRKMLRNKRVKSPFFGYRGYPSASCISVNEEVVHGIPSKKIIKNGDIVSVDLGVTYKGYNTDAARTFIVGICDEESSKLVSATREAFFAGAKMAVEGNCLYDISSEIERVISARNFTLVREFVSHGVGRELHEEPFFVNFGKKNTGPKLKKNMTLAIEPMVNAGVYNVRILEDGWTAVTADRKRSAHYENTVAVKENECEILTENKE
ncbi:MAG: type I methionyl aminopeptidase [bacterium]|nr:type I methionyl aminopeptidase [bacterium]